MTEPADEQLVLIARALAALPDDLVYPATSDEFVDGWHPRECRFCGKPATTERRRAGTDTYINCYHLASCVYHQAVRWVAANPPPPPASLGHLALTGEGTVA